MPKCEFYASPVKWELQVMIKDHKVMCVCSCLSVCVCVCVRERERERERLVQEGTGESGRVCLSQEAERLPHG